MSKVSLPTVLMALLLIVILVLYTFTHQVAFNEVAVRVRFGQADPTNSIIDQPGLKFRWPWPIERIETYDVRLRTLDTPETEIKTFDGKNVIVASYAIWRIADPLQFYTRVRTVGEAERQMRALLSQAQTAVIGPRNLSDFVNLDVEQKERSYDALLAELLGNVQPLASSLYGVQVERVGIRRVSLPKETTQQVFEAMRQERNRLAARYRQEGRARAEAIKARAEAQAKQILAFADRRAQEIRSAGTQAGTRILALIPAEDREFFELLRWYDALRAALAQKTTIFLDHTSPLFKPFVEPPVPLEEVTAPSPSAARGE